MTFVVRCVTTGGSKDPRSFEDSGMNHATTQDHTSEVTHS